MRRFFLILGLLMVAALMLLVLRLLGSDMSGMAEQQPPNQSLNPYILRAVSEYPTDGSYQTLPEELVGASIGTTRDIHYLGQMFWRGDPLHRSYCLGLAFEVFIRACDLRALDVSGRTEFHLRGVDLYGFRGFRASFYGSGGAAGRGDRSIIDTLVSRELGVEIRELDSARPGDLLQFSRNSGTAHAAVFLGWLYSPDNRRIAIHYWGAQGDGISEATEYIGHLRHQVNPSHIFIVRAFLPNLPQSR